MPERDFWAEAASAYDDVEWTADDPAGGRAMELLRQAECAIKEAAELWGLSRLIEATRISPERVTFWFDDCRHVTTRTGSWIGSPRRLDLDFFNSRCEVPPHPVKSKWDRIVALICDCLKANEELETIRSGEIAKIVKRLKAEAVNP